jgi:hypothetical protein
MGGSEDESRVSAVGSDASSMLSPELAKRSSRKKNAIANQYEWTAFGREMTPRSGPDEHPRSKSNTKPNCRKMKQICARGSFAKMRQEFNAASHCSADEHALECATQGARIRKSEAVAQNRE